MKMKTNEKRKEKRVIDGHAILNTLPSRVHCTPVVPLDIKFSTHLVFAAEASLTWSSDFRKATLCSAVCQVKACAKASATYSEPEHTKSNVHVIQGRLQPIEQRAANVVQQYPYLVLQGSLPDVEREEFAVGSGRQHRQEPSLVSSKQIHRASYVLRRFSQGGEDSDHRYMLIRLTKGCLGR